MRFGAKGGLLVGPREMVIAIVAAMTLLASCETDEGERRAPDEGEVTVEDAIDAVSQPGMVFFLEMPIEEPGQEIVLRLWYDPETERTRTEEYDGGVLVDADLVDSARTVSYNFRDGLLFDHPTGPAPAGAPNAAVAMLPHIGVWLSPGAVLDGETDIDGVRVHHIAATTVNTEPGDETPDGTEFTFDVYVRTDTLMPVSARYTAVYPDDPQAVREMRFTRAEAVERDSLAGDFFDPAVLTANDVTLDEALAMAGRQPFATFWLGREIAGEWTHPDGRTYASQRVTEVYVPGVPRGIDGRVRIEYGPGTGVAPALLHLDQGPAGAFEPMRASDLAAIRTAGNVTEAPEVGGYLYVRYVGKASCSDAEAQAKPECRMPGVTPHRGIVVEREGTVVHLSVTAFGESVGAPADENPFGSEAALIALVRQLVRIP